MRVVAASRVMVWEVSGASLLLTDGTGRDFYIAANNGGMSRGRRVMPRISTRVGKTSSPFVHAATAPPVHYYR
jgi:hypothetical protein